MFSRFRAAQAAEQSPAVGACAHGSTAGDATSQRFTGRRDFEIEAGVDDWGLTPAQQEAAVEEFRRKLVALDPALWDPQRHDFFTLRRFLRARSHHTARAVDMWRAHLQWRRDNDVDSVLRDFSFPERSEFLRHAPQGYYHTDREGRPVYVQLLGAADLGALRRIATEDRMFRFIIHEHEYVCKVMLPLCSRLAGRHVGTCFNIVDVKGLRLSQLTSDTLRFFQRVAKMDQDHYPEMLAHVAVVNAPPVFRLVWGMVRRFLEPRTQAKIQILGPNYLAALEQWIAPEHIPPLLAREGAAAAAAAAGQQHAHAHHPPHLWRRHSSGVSEEHAAPTARLEEAARQLEGNEGPWRDLMLFERLGLDPQQLKTGLLPPPPPPPPPTAAASAAAAADGRAAQPPAAALTAAAGSGGDTSTQVDGAILAASAASLQQHRQLEKAEQGPEEASESDTGAGRCLQECGDGVPARSWADLEDLRLRSASPPAGRRRHSHHHHHKRQHHAHPGHGHGHGHAKHRHTHHRPHRRQLSQQAGGGEDAEEEDGGEAEEEGGEEAVEEGGGDELQGADQGGLINAGLPDLATPQKAAPAAMETADGRCAPERAAGNKEEAPPQLVPQQLPPQHQSSAVLLGGGRRQPSVLSAAGPAGATPTASAPCSSRTGTQPTTTATTVSPAPTGTTTSTHSCSAASSPLAAPAAQAAAAVAAGAPAEHAAAGNGAAAAWQGGGGSTTGSSTASSSSSRSAGSSSFSSQALLLQQVARLQQLMAVAVVAAAAGSPQQATGPAAAAPAAGLSPLLHRQLQLLAAHVPHPQPSQHQQPQPQPQLQTQQPLAAGSLLHRVQVLEVALDACLAASCLALQQLLEQRQHPREEGQEEARDEDRQVGRVGGQQARPPADTGSDVRRSGRAAGAVVEAAGSMGASLPTPSATHISGFPSMQEPRTGVMAVPNAAHASASSPSAAHKSDCASSSAGGNRGQQPAGRIRTLTPPPDSPPPRGPCGDPTCPGCGASCVVM
ncbi:hypothetical protein HYH02_006264 [Chlamydomonas schloesseri]|uniref:CRAL-TRIO domain-containing protein n=1 Tax=Chlamydomonas schloesseri TaxID=2026947 RepID=A0A835WK62_9CHLO|nr:hypothetical protein HYH02_006264 [Chlamydomonas schloesseri]|eukprot:KAG2448916.1 hypothetical protein HYH02_006264 [Chlamydomonas schloesseri]